ncbi:MAG TPA: Spy/CpxP family protein refolding chaperone [Burkholderiaceae bacterium]
MIKVLLQTVLALGLAAGATLAAHAQPPEDAIGPHGQGPAEMPPGPHGGMPHPGMMPELAPPPFLHGLDLSETQQDKIFAIMLAEAPLVHEQEKLAHKNGKELHTLLEQDQYDEGKIKSLAEAQSHAMAQLMVLHARGMHQILAVLTPEQKTQLNAMKEKFAGQRHDQMHDPMHGDEH